MPIRPFSLREKPPVLRANWIMMSLLDSVFHPLNNRFKAVGSVLGEAMVWRAKIYLSV